VILQAIGGQSGRVTIAVVAADASLSHFSECDFLIECMRPILPEPQMNQPFQRMTGRGKARRAVVRHRSTRVRQLEQLTALTAFLTVRRDAKDVCGLLPATWKSRSQPC
jgi:hypothetical protein